MPIEGSAEKECDSDLRQQQNYWLERGLQGSLIRSEVYGLDNSTVSTVPYAVTEQRSQVRLIEAQGSSP